MQRALAFASLAMFACLSVQAQTVTTGNMVVVDSNGLVVGPVMEIQEEGVPDWDYLATVVIIDGKPAVIYLQDFKQPNTPSRFFVQRTNQSDEPQVHFESTDCSGQAYLVGAVPPNTRHLAVPENETTQFPASELFIWIWNGQSPSLLTVRSGLLPSGECVTIPVVTEDCYPAVKVPTPYVGPYTTAAVPLESALPLSVPAVTPAGLALLFLLLLGGGWWILRR